MVDKVSAIIQTPADLVNAELVLEVPSYQRPYVWPDADALTLLNDIKKAKDGGEEHYYIGTLLSSVREAGKGGRGAVLELIDGQQRITTLALIALALRRLKIKAELTGFAVLNHRPRLRFAIRDRVESLFGAWAGLKGYKLPSYETIDDDPYLFRLHGALKVLKQRLDALRRKDAKALSELSEFIFDRVKWVNNIVPQAMDLNRLFATMNTSGVQLEQSDILKSLLLKKIKNNKARYEAIWQVCERMDNYFERNVRQVFSDSDWRRITPEQLQEFDADVFILPDGKHSESKREAPRTLGELAASAHTANNVTQGGEPKANGPRRVGEDTVYCRSIIGFPLLLIHAYRAFMGGEGDIETRLHSEMLIKSFKDLIGSDGARIREFFWYLWRVRYQFDRWVVKWVRSEDEGEEVLGLSSVRRVKSKNNWYLQREYKESSPLSQLQAVRYFTGERSAQYWLTPFLGWLVYGGYGDELDLLECLDDQLSLAIDTQKDASRMLLMEDLGEEQLKPFSKIETYLSGDEGTHFEHYWFQKLEYLLWKKWHRDDEYIADKRFKQYRIVSRNSVEHVYPQSGQDDVKLDSDNLDSFGNLVLLNVGQNSAYGAKKVKVKRSMFETNTGAYESLKLSHLFGCLDGWETGTEDYIARINGHRTDMLYILSGHYGARNGRCDG